MLLIAIIGALHVWYPFAGDQALFLLGAMTIEQGGTLYVDFWDNKQPGIFGFYWLAGKLFGFHEEGVHTLELGWMLAYALLLLVSTRRYFKEHRLASLAPLATVGLYYLRGAAGNLTEVEALVPLPLTVCLLLSSRDYPHARQTVLGYAGFGLAASVIAVFKLILITIPCAFWLIAAAAAVSQGRRLSHITLAMMLPALAGFVLGVSPALAYFWSRGAIDALYWTSFVYPPEALRVIPPAPLERLLESVSWFLTPFLVVLPLLVLGLWAAMRWRYGRFGVLLIAWLVVGFGTLLAQQFSWWASHFVMLMPPAGLLTLAGVDEALLRLLPHAGQDRGKVALAIVLLLTPMFITPLQESWPKGMAIIYDVLSRQPLGTTYREHFVPEYTRLYQAAQFLHTPEALPGPIYVFGDPRLLLFSGRSQAIALNGWNWEMMLPAQWQALPQQLALAHPAYIYVSKFYARLIAQRSPDTQQWIRSHYRRDHTTEQGTWYRRGD